MNTKKLILSSLVCFSFIIGMVTIPANATPNEEDSDYISLSKLTTSKEGTITNPSKDTVEYKFSDNIIKIDFTSPFININDKIIPLETEEINGLKLPNFKAKFKRNEEDQIIVKSSLIKDTLNIELNNAEKEEKKENEEETENINDLTNQDQEENTNQTVTTNTRPNQNNNTTQTRPNNRPNRPSGNTGSSNNNSNGNNSSNNNKPTKPVKPPVTDDNNESNDNNSNGNDNSNNNDNSNEDNNTSKPDTGGDNNSNGSDSGSSNTSPEQETQTQDNSN